MIRLFTAIQLPEDLCVRLGLMCGGIPGARWITPDRMHVTLRFIGEVEEPVFDDIRLALSGLDGQALTLGVRGIATFGDKKPRAIYAGIERTEPLVRLKQKIDAALMKIGIGADEERKFIPHITLARLNAYAQTHYARIGGFLATHSLFYAEPFDVNEFHLLSSVLSGEGSIYTIEETFPLC